MKNYKIGRYIIFDRYDGYKKIVPIVSKIYTSCKEAKKDAIKIRNVCYINKLENEKEEIEERIEACREKGVIEVGAWDSDRGKHLYDSDSVILFNDIKNINELELNSFIVYSEEDEKTNINNLFTYFPNYDSYLLNNE